MATVIQLKRSETASDAPDSSDLSVGEVAINLSDRLLYSKKSDGSIVSIGDARVPESFVFANDLDLGNLDPATGDAYDFGSTDAATTLYNMGELLPPVVMAPSPPTSATSSGRVGEITYDSDYVYVCIATNTWKRSQLSSW